MPERSQSAFTAAASAAASGRMPWSIVTATSAVPGAWRARCSLVSNRRASESPPPETAAMTVPQPEKSIFENEAAPATLPGTTTDGDPRWTTA